MSVNVTDFYLIYVALLQIGQQTFIEWRTHRANSVSIKSFLTSSNLIFDVMTYAQGCHAENPLSPEASLCLLQVTTVTLEDLPGRSLSSLVQCPQLRFLSLRRCGLKSLEGINQLKQLGYIDVQVAVQSLYIV